MIVSRFSAARAIAYLFLVAAGAVLPFRVAAVEAPNQLAWLVMSVFLVLGGLSSALGHLSGRYLGEYVGQPLIFTALFGFGTLQLALAGWVALPGVAVLWSFTLLVFARWRDVAAVFRSARATAARP